MKPLSERLSAAADSFEQGWRGDYKVPLLREAAALAKRYEDAPVAYVIEAEGETFIPMAHSWVGQRVRIVLDKEGV